MNVRLGCILVVMTTLAAEAQQLRRDCTPDEIANDAGWSTRLCASSTPAPAPRGRAEPRETALRASQSERQYTEDQMVLAGYIGAVAGLVRKCGVVPMPSVSIRQAVRAAGLKDKDFTEESTAFRKRASEQASTVGVLFALQKSQGMSDAQIAANACRSLTQNYGPKGTIRPGLVPAQ